MKTFLLRPLSLSLMLLGMEIFLLFSCQKEECLNTDDIDESIHPAQEINDIIGFLNPLENTLWVAPGYEETALELLNAHPIPGGHIYQMQGRTASGEPVEIMFVMDNKMSHQLYLATLAVQDPDLVTQFKEKGVPHRLFRNRDPNCVEVPGFTSNCDTLPDNTSNHRVYYNKKNCPLGKGFCVEALLPAGRDITYYNLGCTGAILREETISLWQCPN